MRAMWVVVPGLWLMACEASKPKADPDLLDAAVADASDATIPPANETCDGTDEDMDGRIDEQAGCYLPVYRFIWSNLHDDQDFAYRTSDEGTEPREFDCQPGTKCNPQGEQFAVYRVQVPGTVPLFTLYETSETHHVLTVDAQERDDLLTRGAVDQGILGYVLPRDDQTRPDAVPLFRRYNDNLICHLFTIQEEELTPQAFAVTEVQPDCCKAWPVGTR